MALVDSNMDFIQTDDGNFIACDDAGNTNLCYGESSGLAGAFVSRTEGRQLPGGDFDAMLNIPLSEEMVDGYFNFLMRSAGMETFGDYVVAFHMGIAGN